MGSLASSPATMMRPGVGVAAGSFAGGLVCEIPGGFWTPEVLLDITFVYGVDSSMLPPGQSMIPTLTIGAVSFTLSEFVNLPSATSIRGWARIRARDQGGGNIDLVCTTSSSVWDNTAQVGFAPSNVIGSTGNTFGSPTGVDFVLTGSDDSQLVYPNEFCITTPQF